ncbi:HBS1-like protein isoform X2 [Acanthaster planci]|uniref:HBS1-like protein isoform X2 n=1 Tax=Acanthaster planci TaxID=133434 RepID=A0A8B7Y8K2_ACAPL|nr:HBS1-like protein isoform X2 [Acanthaster planci]
MSRHRNVRGMDYGEDYEGYDDVYGHSVEDDYGVSPSTAEQFIYHRSLQHHRLASFLEEGEDDLKKEEEDSRARRDSERSLGDSANYQRPQLSDIEEAQLQSCLEEIRNVVGETVPERTLIEMAVAHSFNFEKALNAILDQQESGAGNNNNSQAQGGVSDFTIGKCNVVQRTADKKPSTKTKDLLVNRKGQASIQKNQVGSPSSLSDLIKSNAIPYKQVSSNVSKVPLADLMKASHSTKCFSSLAPSRPSAINPQISSLPLSALASSHLASSSKENSKAQGQGSSSLSDLATLHLGTNKGPLAGGSGSAFSLSDLSQHSTLVTPPRMLPTKESQQLGAGGLKPGAGISLSSLASSHLSTKSSKIQSMPSQRTSTISSSNVPPSGMEIGQGAQRPGAGTGSSLFSLATAHLSSSAHRVQAAVKCPSIGQTPPTRPHGMAGLSLSNLAMAHQSSTLALPPAAMKPAGASLERLAKTHLSQDLSAKSTLMSLNTKPATVDSHNPLPDAEPVKGSWSTLKNIPGELMVEKAAKMSAHSHSTVIPTEESEIQLHKATSSTGPASPPGFQPVSAKSPPGFGSVTSEETEGSELKKRVPTPPGFQSRIVSTPDHNSAVDIRSSDPHDYVNFPATTDQETKPLPKLHRLYVRQDRFYLLANPSVFGRALCSKYMDKSRELSDQRGLRIASYVFQKQHSRPTVNRQFSYQRQTSWSGGTADPGSEIIPFDFSSPSPDDIIREKQAGAFCSTNGRSLGVAAQLPVKQPSPSRQKHMVPVAAATAMAANDTAVSAVAQEVAKLSMPSKEAKRGFELGPVPAKSGDKRRKSAASRTKLGGEFLDGMPDSNLRSESKGKLPTVMSAPDLTSMAGSPAPALPGAQPSTRRESKTSKAGNIDISKEYSKRQEGKQLINLVVIGHVDAGKSTLMGHLLYLLGQVNQRQMHKYEQESKKLGKASFAYAWVLDETGEERQRGITMDVGLTNFETSNRIVTLLDAPGHKDFIPNMITGAAQADVAIMVVDATRGEFETGFDAGGQTREHALLVRSLGVTQLAVAINKLDTVGWAEERFSEIVGKLGHFLKQAGFKESEVQYIPCSGLTGENLKDRATEPALTKWYKGPSLVERIDSLKAPKRPIEKAFRQCVSDVFKGIGAGISIAGKIESGGVQVGDRVVIMPAGETGQVRGVYIHDEESRWACAGDYATVVVTSIDQVNIGVGSVVCSIDHPIPVASRFRARVIMFNLDVPVTKGFPVLLHYQTVSEPAVICKLVSTLHKSTGEVLQKRPKCLTKQSNAIIDIETSRPVCLELYRDCKDLGRFMLRYSGSTIGAGVVTEIKR